jgi:threonine dehydratase
LNLKLELLQHSGSFKARGAFTNLLSRAVPPAGIVAASGGNHGAAMAYAARALGIPARIYVPGIASKAKIERIQSYGAHLEVIGEQYADALAASEAWIRATGAMAVHAFDQKETLMGQGTTAREWHQQCTHLDTVLVSVGGGGLIGGMAIAFDSKVKVVGVEPALAPTLHNALAAGQPVDSPVGGIAADSLGAKRVGELMFPIAQAHIANVVLVSDEAILDAQRQLWNTLRVVAEPGAATALAALLSHAYVPGHDERVGVLVCGGNTSSVEF